MIASKKLTQYSDRSSQVSEVLVKARVVQTNQPLCGWDIYFPLYAASWLHQSGFSLKRVGDGFVVSVPTEEKAQKIAADWDKESTHFVLVPQREQV